MNSRIYQIVAIVFLVTSSIACTERIEIDLKDNYTRLVVEGSITTDTTSHRIYLTKTSSYYFNEKPPVVSNAAVTITDGEQIFNLNEIEPGVYATDSNVFALPGKNYTLNIVLESPIDNHTIYSASSFVSPVQALDSIDVVFRPEWGRMGIWEIKCYVQEPPSIDFYRFIIHKNDAPLTDSLSEWFVTDDKFFNGNYTNGVSVSFLNQGRDSEALRVGDKITVEVNSISKEYANFLWEAQSEVRGTNPLFSGPPANVKGNITNGAIGFFAAYSVTRKSKNTPDF